MDTFFFEKKKVPTKWAPAFMKIKLKDYKIWPAVYKHYTSVNIDKKANNKL
jgi:hypothetical protein